MAKMSRRLQILLSEDHREFLEELSEKERRPIAEIIRSALENTYRPRFSLERKQALARLERTIYFGN